MTLQRAHPFSFDPISGIISERRPLGAGIQGCVVTACFAEAQSVHSLEESIISSRFVKRKKKKSISKSKNHSLEMEVNKGTPCSFIR